MPEPGGSRRDSGVTRLRPGRLLAALALTALAAVRAPAQQPGAWNDARATDLAQRAVARRMATLADTGLRAYEARARGYVTFLAQAGEGLELPPKVVKADELGLEIFWRAPGESKQRILGRRDTTLLPTDIAYHRDHLGIVQNNFPAIIRLGDGDEVRDVPHPLSPAGLPLYELRLVDSLRIRLPAGEPIEVYQLQVRPRDPSQPRAVGSLFIERASAQLVRMSLSFTRAALKDEQLEDLVVTLENGLVEGRFWLPRRQEIEIRRSGTWLDFPFRGIIRGRWEIRDYAVNAEIPPATFDGGDEIVMAPPERRRDFRFEGGVLDRLPPEVRAATDDDVRVAQEQARAMVRGELLARRTGTQLAGRAVSDFLRVNRVEGFATGVGVARRLGAGWRVDGHARWATAEGTARGGAGVGWEGASGAGVLVRAARELGEINLVPEASGVANSIAAQEFGRDWTNPYDRRLVALRADLPVLGEAKWRLGVEGAVERHGQVGVNATPSRGRFEPVPPVDALDAVRLSLFARRPTAIGIGGGELRVAAALDLWGSERRDVVAAPTRWHLRPTLDLEWQDQRDARTRLVLRTIAGGVVGPVAPPQLLVRFGGAVTLPGVPFGSEVGTWGVSQRIEWQRRIGAPSLPLGRYGRTPANVVLAPYLVAAVARNGAVGRVRPAVGVALLSLFDVLRLDVAVPIGTPRPGVMVHVDVTRDFWRIL